jgi:hypothetical protein
VVTTAVRNTKWLKNGKLRRAILSAFYNISQRNFGILLILWCSFKLWWNFCLGDYGLVESKFWKSGNHFLLVIQNDWKLQTSQGYIIRILQHFATKLWNITNFVMLFQAVMKFLSRLVEVKILINMGLVHCSIAVPFLFITSCICSSRYSRFFINEFDNFSRKLWNSYAAINLLRQSCTAKINLRKIFLKMRR